MPAVDYESATEWIDHDPDGHQAWIRLARIRIEFGLLFVLLILLTPAFGPERFAVVAITGSLSFIGNVALLIYAKRGGMIGLPVAAQDMVLTILFVALVPESFAPALLLLLAMSAMWVFWVGKKVSVMLMAWATLGFMMIGIANPGIDNWIMYLITFVATSGVSISVVSSVSSAVTRANNRYDGLVNGISAVVWEAHGLVGDPEFINSAVTNVLGLSRSDSLAPGFLSSRIHTDDIEAYIESRKQVASGEPAEVHYRIRDACGSTRYLHERITISEDPEGRHSRRGVIVDETAEALAEAALRGYDDFIAGAPTAMAILRLDDLDDPSSLRIVSGNPAAAVLLRTTVEDATGKRLCDLVPNIPIFSERLANVSVLNTSLEAPSIKILNSESVYSLRAIPLPDQSIGLTIDDVTKAARTAESLKHQALHDNLTGLPNRVYFNERLDRALKARGSDENPCDVAVLMIDLNKFKDVNDNLGHEYGDKLLVALAKRLGRNIRGCDTIARLGGDEFAILIRSGTPIQTARDVAERIEQLVIEPFEIDQYSLCIGASIGVSACELSGASSRSLLRDADNAMYRAKSFGGGTFVHGDDHHSSELIVSIASELDAALHGDEIEVLYQPRIDLPTMTVTGMEALARWRHPRLGLLEPEQFLEVADSSGMAHLLTRVVAQKAVSDLASVIAHDPRINSDSLTLTVNAARVNLVDSMFPAMMEQLAEHAGVSTMNLRVDVSESLVVADLRDLLPTMHGLQRAGVHVTLDKFGLGDSTVRLLSELPADEVKLDQSLVRELGGANEPLPRAMIRLAREFGLTVSANGVESTTEVERLRLYGCDVAQGFYFARPLTADEFKIFLGTFNPSLHQTSDL